MTSTGPGSPPGLQPERTRLAWARTALAFAADGALLAKTGVTKGGSAAVIPGLLVLAFAAVVYIVGACRYRAGPDAPEPPGHYAYPGLVALLSLLSGLLAAVTIGLG